MSTNNVSKPTIQEIQARNIKQLRGALSKLLMWAEGMWPHGMSDAFPAVLDARDALHLDAVYTAQSSKRQVSAKSNQRTPKKHTP